MTDLPSIEQIERAEVSLCTAHHTAVGIGYYVLSRKDAPAADILRRSLMSSLEEAARALGYKLEPIARLAVDNDTEPNTMREVQ